MRISSTCIHITSTPLANNLMTQKCSNCLDGTGQLGWICQGNSTSTPHRGITRAKTKWCKSSQQVQLILQWLLNWFLANGKKATLLRPTWNQKVFCNYFMPDLLTDNIISYLIGVWQTALWNGFYIGASWLVLIIKSLGNFSVLMLKFHLIHIWKSSVIQLIKMQFQTFL